MNIAVKVQTFSKGNAKWYISVLRNIYRTSPIKSNCLIFDYYVVLDSCVLYSVVRMYFGDKQLWQEQY